MIPFIIKRAGKAAANMIRMMMPAVRLPSSPKMYRTRTVDNKNTGRISPKERFVNTTREPVPNNINIKGMKKLNNAGAEIIVFTILF